ncbi:kinase-like domain-containing protein [Roridomyces roridus]|uniref:Kinase-like domain-containing protein n=1 Tax=Roridomyces roridus TaxID=1738132 RepID=A0AAD7FP64_9AGAR|nr:kinase-like domain-containing protein [Roridomyces roridus]
MTDFRPPARDPSKPRRKHLFANEDFWVDCQPFLLSQGYQLRPRYHPDWIPSWTVKQRLDGNYEDDLWNLFEWVLDATRLSDGSKVILKCVHTDGKEIRVFKHLDSLRDDPRNRTIPILDIINMPDSLWSFIAMPYCRRFDYPPFHCRNEFLDAMTQFLEGLQFMHDHNVVHFDIAPQNLVMEEAKVVPYGSHLSDDRSHTGFPRRWLYWKNRCSVRPVEYYYIDFGLSLYYPDGKDTASIAATLRTFPNIPELSRTVPYNPFFVDIYQLGLTMHKLIDDYVELGPFRPVAESMTARDPKSRPTAANALAHLHRIAAEIPLEKLAERMWRRDVKLRFGGYENDLPNFYVSMVLKRVLDATRISDGKKVTLKRVLTDGHEIRCFEYLDSLREDPRNRTIPLLDIIPMPARGLSSDCNSCMITTSSILTSRPKLGHGRGKVVPQGTDFSDDRSHTGFPRRWFYWKNRCSVGPVQYYYIDFGLSLYFPDGKDTATHTATLRTFSEIPELSDTVPYNPFYVDVYQLGLTMHELIDDYVELEDFRPVAESRTAQDPTSRPTPGDALAHLRHIAAGLPPAKLAEQMWQKDTRLGQKVSFLLWGGWKQDWRYPLYKPGDAQASVLNGKSVRKL